jgi:Zn-dependent protease with chaperone function
MNTHANVTAKANADVTAKANGISAQWFDGKSARRTPVAIKISGLTIAIVDEANNVLAHVPRDLVRVSERIANTPYRLEFPDGALAVTSDHAAVERSFKLNPGAHWLAKMERNSWAVVAAMLGLFVALYFAYDYFIPKIASAVAERIPRETETSLGDATVKSLDGFMFKKTEIDANQQAKIRTEFDRLAKAANMSEHVTLEFRRMAPNALAIPGGTIVVTDGLVGLFKGDERLIGAVLAHEIGHIYHRHSLKHLLEGSASALIVGALVGDVSGVSALVTTAPVILSSLAYTRESEAEADRYAFALLRSAGRSTIDFADAMRRFNVMEDCMILRSDDGAKGARRRTSEMSNLNEEEEDETPVAKSKSKPAKKRDVCIDDPESITKGREGDIEKLRREDGDEQTGYLHTHPVTQERIRAAEAAAK